MFSAVQVFLRSRGSAGFPFSFIRLSVLSLIEIKTIAAAGLSIRADPAIFPSALQII
jgi:hypothetical protein